MIAVENQIYEDTKTPRTLRVLEVTNIYVHLCCLETGRETSILRYNFERLKRFRLVEKEKKS